MPLTANEARIAADRADVYPAGHGASWGYGESWAEDTDEPGDFQYG